MKLQIRVTESWYRRGETYMHFIGSGGDLDGGEPIPKLSNVPTIGEEGQAHYQCKPKGYGRLSYHLDQIALPGPK
jgi:hypothetical protein